MAIRIDRDLETLFIYEADGAVMPDPTGPWHFAGHMRLEGNSGTNSPLIVWYGNEAGSIYYGLYAVGTSVLLLGNDGTGEDSGGSTTIAVGADYEISLGYDGAGTLTARINGVTLTLETSVSAGETGHHSITWAAFGLISGWIDSTWERWRMWEDYLTIEELDDEFHSLTPVRTADLISNWPMAPGSTRFDDTLTTTNDLADNPAVPTTDDGEAFRQILTEPVAASEPVGDTATFTVTATGQGTLSYQWQRNTGSGWADISGATSASYTTGTLGAGDNGHTFRCVLTDDNGSTTSASALLTITGITLLTPLIIGTPLYIAMSASATPGAQAVGTVEAPTTVPADALGVLVFVDMAGYPSATDITSLSSNFADTFTSFKVAQDAAALGMGVYYAKVTSTGAGKTVTPVFNSTNNFSGAGMHVVFLKDIDPDDFVVEPDGANSADGTAAASATVVSLASYLVLVRDTHGTTTDADYPALASGFTNLSTGFVNAGTIGYRSGTRLKRVTTPVDGTASATTQNTLASVIALVSIKGAVAGTTHNLAAAALSTATASAALSLVKAMAAAAAGQASGSAAMAVLKPLSASGAAAADADADLQTAAAPVELGANGAAIASASASLLKGVTLSGAGLAVVSASASTSHSVPLQATGVAVAVSGALMALAVTLSASGLGVAAASAGASLVKALGATGAAQADGSATLTTSSSTDLLASGVAVASSTAVLSLLVTLSGAAVAQAQAQAALGMAKPLGAAGTGQAGGSATLATSSSTDLEGHGSAQASSGASLWLDVPLTAAALSQALAGGSITLSVPLHAAAVSQSAGSASLGGAIALSAGGSAASSATASLQVMGPVFEFARGMVAKNERRNWTAKNNPRSWRATA